MSLYKKLVRLAYQKPPLRPHLLPLLKTADVYGDLNKEGLQRALEDANPGYFQVEFFHVNRRPSRFVIEGKILPGEVASGLNPMAFKKMVMDGLHRYSFRLPGEISVKARSVGPSVLFVLEGKTER